MVGQPEGTAIYFGLDFDFEASDHADVMHGSNGNIPVTYGNGTRVKNADLKKACATYFRTLNERIGKKFALGVYGNGYASLFLRDDKLQGARLVTYVWLSGATGHTGTIDVIRRGGWHLFQNRLDRNWFTTVDACGKGLDVDANVQNPAFPDIGAWHKGGAYLVEQKRTEAIYKHRRPCTVDRTPILTESGKAVAALHCFKKTAVVEAEIKKRRVQRILGTKNIDGKDYVEVDLNEDGKGGNYCLAEHFAEHIMDMPA